MQFQADILGIPVQLSAIAETTALGAGYLAGLSSGYWKSREEIARQRQLVKSFQPLFDDRKRDKLLEGWRKAVQAARQFKI